MSSLHIPVMLTEVIEDLFSCSDGIYLDLTFGRGGHSQACLAKLGPNATLLCVDQDPDAIEVAQQLAAQDPRVQVLHSNFSNLHGFLAQQNWLQRINGVLIDLGVSSCQLDDATRGFSWRDTAKLDMRMNPHEAEPLAETLAKLDESTLAQILWHYGEERYSRRIAQAIVSAKPETTTELADLVCQAIPRRAWPIKIHPATRTFLALRLYINRELEHLATLLAQLPNYFAPHAHLVCLSFHSLEDRMIKRQIQAWVKAHNCRWIHKKRRASAAEIELNPRSRSALLRSICWLPPANSNR